MNGFLDAHYETIGFTLFSIVLVSPTLPLAYFAGQWRTNRKDLKKRRASLIRLLLSLIGATAIYIGIFSWGVLVEPSWPELNQLQLAGPFQPPLRVLHLSDLHIERDFPSRERWMLDQTEKLKPDLIVITGDIHQIGNNDADSLRHVLSKLNAPLGVYACIGFDDVSLLQNAAPHIRILLNEAATVPYKGQEIALGGLSAGGRRESLYAMMKDASYRIVLNHTPDLAEESARNGVDLYLCGHTHGGQVRLPFWGAIITLAETGKRFEAGKYRVGNMTLYTSRGLGLEPPPAPQVRFLCRPEACLVTIGKT